MTKNKKFEVDNVPVFWRESTSYASVSGIPDRHVLSVYHDEALNLLKQSYSDETNSALENMYARDENIGYLREDHPLSKVYGPEFLEFIKDRCDISSRRVLDIGCGGLYVLKRLKAAGASVLGCDPSPFAIDAGHINDIAVVDDFFPTTKLQEKVDVILHFDVLEHIWDPLVFLKHCIVQLKNSGVTIFSIPDCGDQISRADITLFAHQHVNFFTRSSIGNLMEQVGFGDIYIERSAITGKLQCFGRKNGGNGRGGFAIQSAQEADNFLAEVGANYDRIRADISIAIRDLKGDETIGFYPPLRAMPYLVGFVDDDRYLRRLRFIDDNELAEGKYMCNVKVQIFPLTHETHNNCKIIYVASKAYSEVMTEKIRIHHHDVEIRYI